MRDDLERPVAHVEAISDAASPEVALDSGSLFPGAAGEAIPLGRPTGEQVDQFEAMAGPRIVCGVSHPNAEVEQRLEAMRAADDEFSSGGCGKSIALWLHGYRCADCGRWLHHDCLVAHFAEHGDTLRRELADLLAERTRLLAVAEAAEEAWKAGQEYNDAVKNWTPDDDSWKAKSIALSRSRGVLDAAVAAWREPAALEPRR